MKDSKGQRKKDVTLLLHQIEHDIDILLVQLDLRLNRSFPFWGVLYFKSI